MNYFLTIFCLSICTGVNFGLWQNSIAAGSFMFCLLCFLSTNGDKMSEPVFSKWLSISWYQYLFTDLKWADDGRFHKLEVILCRIKGHPRGRVFFNAGGWEPDNSCKDCGDEL